MTEAEQEAIAREWIMRLGLEKWKIRGMLDAAPEDFNSSDEIRAGETEWVAVTRRATIKILRKEAYAAPEEYDFELTLVHELLHLVFAPFYPSTGDWIVALKYIDALEKEKSSNTITVRDILRMYDGDVKLFCWKDHNLWINGMASALLDISDKLLDLPVDCIEPRHTQADNRTRLYIWTKEAAAE